MLDNMCFQIIILYQGYSTEGEKEIDETVSYIHFGLLCKPNEYYGQYVLFNCSNTVPWNTVLDKLVVHPLVEFFSF